MQQTKAPVPDTEMTNDEMTRAFAGSEPVVVKREGQVIGYYIPALPVDGTAAREAMERWREAVQLALAESGMTEDEFADALIIGEGHDIAPRG